MRSTTVALILTFSLVCLASAEYADERVTSLQINSAVPVAPDTLPAEGLRLRQVDDAIYLTWNASLRRHPTGGPGLTGYLVFMGRDPSNLQFLAFTVSERFRHRGALDIGCGFYCVKALYAGRSEVLRRSRSIHRDSIEVLLDFEEGDFELLSYSEEEDADPDAWEVTDEEALPPSERSLKLSGNTWKRMEFQETEMAENTVWSIGILSIDGDTLGELQAFGLGDGQERLFYAFHGQELIWDAQWVVVNQESRDRGQWNVYLLDLGYDWGMRYGYLPTINELFFINDNDTTDPPAWVYFDELIDITGTIPPEPAPRIRWRVDPAVEASGRVVDFSAYVFNRAQDELTFLWDFGDGGTSVRQNLRYAYRSDGVYTVGLTAAGIEGLIGYDTDVIQIGRLDQYANLTVCLTGDVMLARRLEPFIEENGPEAVFGRILESLEPADLMMFNLECPLTDEGEPHPTKDYVFRGRPEYVAGLVYAGADVVSLANNHLVDFGRRGFEETTEVLDAAGIDHCGAGFNKYEALRPVFHTIDGIRVGFMGFCNRTGRDYNNRPFMDAGYDKYGFAYFSVDNLIENIPDAAEQCDVLIIGVHGGVEYSDVPFDFDPDDPLAMDPEEWMIFTAERDSATRELEHLAIDLGVDIVVAHHPHVLQGFEIYDGALIAHSLGNFVFDQNMWETWVSATVWVELNRNGLQRAWVQPIFIDGYLPTPAIGALGQKILNRLAGYSRELDCYLAPVEDRSTASIALDPRQLVERQSEYRVHGRMRYLETDSVYCSEPLRLDGGGFPTRIVSIDPRVEDADWEVSLGREILLAGNMEQEGASVWNYNSDWERPDQEYVHRGQFSSRLNRTAGMRDIITNLKQRIPVINPAEYRLTLCGWLRTVNAGNGGITARYFRFRYSNDPRWILGTQVVEGWLQGDHDWTYVWELLEVPAQTSFIDIRCQLYAPAFGEALLWADDLELIRWEPPEPFDGVLDIDTPGDLYYLQLQTRQPVEHVTVTYRTVTLSMR